jgi:hypothetical protein
MRMRRLVVDRNFFVIACSSTPQDDGDGPHTEQTATAETRAAQREA